MRKLILAAVAGLLVAALPGVAGAQASGGQVTVVHGVPGLTVDVYVNGDLTLEDFGPGDVAGPLDLPAGTYDLAITAADDSIDNAVLTGSANLGDGDNVSIIAHLQEDGTPTIGIFANDTSAISPGQGRLTVRHTAAAPAVDVLLADGTAVFSNVSNPQEGVTQVPALTYSAAIAPAGAGIDAAVFGPVDLEIPEGTNRIVYATGDLAGGSFALVIQDIAGLGSAPAAVNSGSGDLAAGGSSGWLIAAALLGALGLAISTRYVFARTR